MLDEFRSQKIVWDKANNNIYEKIEAHAGDTNGRKLVVQVINSGVVEDLTGASLSLAWKGKGHVGLDAFTDVDLEKGLFEIYYTTEMLANVGILKASLVLVDSKGRIESKSFDIHVNKSNVDDEAAESDNSFTALTQALVKVNDFDNRLINTNERIDSEINGVNNKIDSEISTTNKRIDNIIATPTEVSEQEIIDARYDTVDDVLYDSLGARLNQERLDYANLNDRVDNITTPLKAVDEVKTENLFNKEKIRTGGYYNPSDGNWYENQAYVSSDFIPVETRRYKASVFSIVVYWDANKDFVKSTQDFEINVDDSRIKFVTLSFPKSEIDNMFFGKGEYFSEGPIPHTKWKPDKNKWDVVNREEFERANIVMKNEIVNGPSYTSPTGHTVGQWRKSAYTGDFYISEDNIITASTGGWWYCGAYQFVHGLKPGDKFFFSMEMRSSNFENVDRIRILNENSIGSNMLTFWRIDSEVKNNEWNNFTAVFDIETDRKEFVIFVQSKTETAEVVVDITNVLLINLTETFGKGNEPNEQEMNLLLQIIDKKWWEGKKIIEPKHLMKWQKYLSNESNDNLEFEVAPLLQKILNHDFIFTIGYDDASASIYEYAFPVHQAHDVPGTFWVTTGKVEGEVGEGSWGPVVTWEQLREMQNSEIGTITVGGHSHGHIRYGEATPEQLHSDLKTSMDIFLREGFKPKYMSYPGGSSSILAQQYVSAYFKAARGAFVHSGFNVGQNGRGTNRYYIDSVSIDAPSVDNIKAIITTAKNKKKNNEMVWLDVFMHMVHPDGVSTTGGKVKTPEELSEIIQFVKDNNGLILSFDDAINAFMENYYWTEHKAFQVKQILI